MDFDGFMSACREQWPAFGDDAALAAAPHPGDRRLASLPRQVEGFATENKLMLLNLAVRHMAPDEVYVEVGAWKGLSLAGAAAGNGDRPIFACDDFSRFGGTLEALETTIAEHCAPDQVDVHVGDYRDFLSHAPWRPREVGVYFYDGPHNFRHQIRGLELILPSLADDAVVVVDDTNDRPVAAANRLFTRYVPSMERVLDIRSQSYMHPHWWNGIQVFRWRGDGGAARRPIPLRAYLPRLALWNRGVVYGQRLRHFALKALGRVGGEAAPR